MRNPIKQLNVKWVVVGLVVLVAFTVAGAAIARDGANAAEPDPAADILGRIGSPRVTGLSAVGETARVEGAAATPGAESTRSLWYQTLAGAALAQKLGANAVSRRVVDASGAVLAEETDSVGAGGPDAFVPLERSAADIVQGTRTRVRSLGARLVSTHFVRLFGGTAELVIQPDDPSTFVASAGSSLAILLGDLAQNQRPYLVTVVDAAGKPILVLGYTPSVGGTIGQGLGWQADDVDSDAIWGIVDSS